MPLSPPSHSRVRPLGSWCSGALCWQLSSPTASFGWLLLCVFRATDRSVCGIRSALTPPPRVLCGPDAVVSISGRSFGAFTFFLKYLRVSASRLRCLERMERGRPLHLPILWVSTASVLTLLVDFSTCMDRIFSFLCLLGNVLWHSRREFCPDQRSCFGNPRNCLQLCVIKLLQPFCLLLS